MELAYIKGYQKERYETYIHNLLIEIMNENNIKYFDLFKNEKINIYHLWNIYNIANIISQFLNINESDFSDKPNDEIIIQQIRDEINFIYQKIRTNNNTNYIYDNIILIIKYLIKSLRKTDSYTKIYMTYHRIQILILLFEPSPRDIIYYSIDTLKNEYENLYENIIGEYDEDENTGNFKFIIPGLIHQFKI